MSIDRIKKQASNLVRHLPDHLKSHTKPFALSACQELAAKINGFSDFHAATQRSLTQVNSAPVPPPLITPPKKPHSNPNLQPKPWQLLDEPYQSDLDLTPLPSGVIEYSVHPGQPISRGRYWIVDIGVEFVSRKSRTAFIFDPLDEQGNPGVDELGIQTDAVLRHRLVERAVNDVHVTAIKPCLFVLTINTPDDAGKSKHPHALCFDLGEAGPLDKKIILVADRFASIQDQLEKLKVLRPYERYVLREARFSYKFHSYVRAEGFVDESYDFARIEASKETFVKTLDFIDCFHVLNSMQSIGFRAIGPQSDSDSWIFSAMTDMARFEPEINELIKDWYKPFPKFKVTEEKKTLAGFVRNLRGDNKNEKLDKDSGDAIALRYRKKAEMRL